jgi:hypothetical protein
LANPWLSRSNHPIAASPRSGLHQILYQHLTQNRTLAPPHPPGFLDSTLMVVSAEMQNSVDQQDR